MRDDGPKSSRNLVYFRLLSSKNAVGEGARDIDK